MEPDTALEDEGSEELPEDLLDSQDGEEGESEEQTDDEPYEDEIAEKEEEVQSEVSSVSNVMEETDSDEMPEIQRGAAQVFPEEQWRRPVQRLQRLLLSCLLPVLLALLAVYAAFRGVKLIARLIYDLYIVTRYLILLCVRIALFPFFLIWLVLPSFIQDFLFEKYEQSLGKPVKLVLRAHKAVQETITDIPDMLWACAEALYAACLLPVAQTCRSLCWLICGKNLLESVLDPLHDAQVNRAGWRKRKLIDGRGEKQRGASQAMLASSHLRRAKASALRAKARQQRQKRRQNQRHIQLALPVHLMNSLKPHEQSIQLAEHDASKVKSRVMIVERRYAVFVGFAWMVAGMVVLVLTLAGEESETCITCSVPKQGLRMCRRVQGRDCAFERHSSEVVASIILMGVGMVLAIYAACLYRPRSKSAEAIAEEEAEEKKRYQALAARIKKTEDLEAQVFSMLEDHFQRPSCAKFVRDCYYASCGHLQHAFDSCGRGMLKRALKCEQRRRLRQRSVAAQEVVIFLAFGWLAHLCACLSRCVAGACSKRVSLASQRAKAPRCCSGLQRKLQQCYVWRAFIYWTGFSRAEGFDSKMVDAAKRTDAKGARSLEETLAQFGLDAVVAQETTKETTVTMQSLMTDSGFEETALEAGFTGNDQAQEVLEMDLELRDEDRAMEPQEEKEDLPLNDCEEELHIS